jgi:hypothetical protein
VLIFSSQQQLVLLVLTSVFLLAAFFKTCFFAFGRKFCFILHLENHQLKSPSIKDSPLSLSRLTLTSSVLEDKVLPTIHTHPSTCAFSLHRHHLPSLPTFSPTCTNPKSFDQLLILYLFVVTSYPLFYLSNC